MTDYQRATAANLRAAWAGTPAIPTRVDLDVAIRLATADDAHPPTDADVDAIGDLLVDLLAYCTAGKVLP